MVTKMMAMKKMMLNCQNVLNLWNRLRENTDLSAAVKC